MSRAVTEMENGIGVVEGSPIHSEHMDETLTIVFGNCNTGLGIKIVGGKSEEDIHKDYGIFIRRVIPEGLASQDGRLREGDQILSVNGESLLRVSNERAVQLLRSASATNHVTLVVTRNPSAMRHFSELLDNQLSGLQNSRGNSSSGTTSPTGSQSSLASTQYGQYLPAERVWSTSPRWVPGTTSSVYSDSSSTISSHHAHQNLPRIPNLQEISVTKTAGLGITIQGGSNSADGPSVYISHIVQGGDCHKDGRLQTGDQLVAVDGTSLIGLMHEDAKAVLTRTRLRTDKDTVQIAFVPRLNPQSSRPDSSAKQSYPVSSGHIQPDHKRQTHTSPAMGGRQGSVSSVMKSSNLQQQNKHLQPARTTPSLQQQHRINSHTSPNHPPQGLSADTTNPQFHGDDYHHHHMLPTSRAVSSPQLPPIPGLGLSGTLPDGLHRLQQERLLFQSPVMSSTLQDGHTVVNGVVTDDLRRLVLTQGQNAVPSPVMPDNSANIMGESLQHTIQSSRQSLPSPMSHSMSPGRRLLIDPHVRLKMDKLEVALRYLGISPNEEEKQTLRTRLHVDQSGTVPYGDFVTVTKELFKMQLDESHLNTPGGKCYDVTDFADPPPFQSQVYEPPQSSLISSNDGRLRQERDDALQQVEKLKIMLQEKERSCNLAEEELLRIRKEAQGAIHESRALKSRVHLAEAAQKEARNMEVDYEEAMRLLEDEIVILKQKLKLSQPNKNADVSRSASPMDLQKRLAILGCELRKAQISKKTYEVATERLLQFAELVHEEMTDGPGSAIASARVRGEAARRRANGNGYRPPGYLAKHGKPGPINLANESRDTVRAVKALTEVEPLPCGWEEAYTKDGMKYYTNHQTQGTSWIHPVSNVNHLPEEVQLSPKES